jgi:uncharacterized protein (TIGR02452 family)
MLDLAGRRAICVDTVRRSAAITASTPGGSLTSYFTSSQLPPLTKTDPKFPSLTLRDALKIFNYDAFALARLLTFPFHPQTPGKVGVLNLASDQEPAGGWNYTLSTTQEEALCYSSTLYATLKPEWYPWPNTGPGSCAGIVSAGVVVFRDTLDHQLRDLPEQERHVVTVLTVAAPCWPAISEDGESFAKESDLEDLREKILLVLRMAAGEGVTKLVLGAMGCGAYGCPPRTVAREMKAALQSKEFEGWFEVVAFAVYAAGPAGMRNWAMFWDIFEGT